MLRLILLVVSCYALPLPLLSFPFATYKTGTSDHVIESVGTSNAQATFTPTNKNPFTNQGLKFALGDSLKINSYLGSSTFTFTFFLFRAKYEDVMALITFVKSSSVALQVYRRHDKIVEIDAASPSTISDPPPTGTPEFEAGKQ